MGKTASPKAESLRHLLPQRKTAASGRPNVNVSCLKKGETEVTKAIATVEQKQATQQGGPGGNTNHEPVCSQDRERNVNEVRHLIEDHFPIEMPFTRTIHRPKDQKGIAESHREFRGLIQGFGFRLRKDDEGTPYVPGKHGKIEWHSFNNETLAIYSNKSIAKGRLIRHQKCRVWQRADWEVRVLVAREDVVEVAKIIRPYRKRKISAERREQLLKNFQLQRLTQR